MVVLYLLIGIFIGVALALLFIRRFLMRRVIPFFEKGVELRKTGTRIEAMVTRIERYPYATFPRQVYTLMAQWQQPRTGKVFTYQGRTTKPERFPVGSLVPVLIDPNDPAGLYFMEGLQDQEDEAKD